MGPVRYPADHKPGMPVPRGGSSCRTCKYLHDSHYCGNTYFTTWQGHDRIPGPVDAFCSDWYEPREGAR